MISKAEFFKAAGLKRATVTIDALGADVEIVEMDLVTRSELMALYKDGTTTEAAAQFLLSKCVPFLESPTAEEINAISPPIAAEIAEKVMEISGMGATATEEAEKN